MNVCWPFFSIIKLYVQFTWQSQTSLCAVMCWPFGSACEKVPGLPAPKQKQAQIRESWQVLQQVRFALAEKADVSLLLRQCCFTSGICTPQIMLAISLVANVRVKMLHVSIRVTELCVLLCAPDQLPTQRIPELQRGSMWGCLPEASCHFCTNHTLVFQDIDKFGNEITQLARPLPVEYLIIDVSIHCTLLAAGGGQSS